ncbi:MAG: DUF2953 domain-containing protein, partial [Oscillospiraceae bacterium]|nr:DUF2953 domain-containing protein [Oscillospiraceae bacterium]
MTALIVIAAVILFFALVLNIKLRVQIKYIGGILDIKLKYLWFTLYPLKKKKPRKKKKVKKSKEDFAVKEDTVENEPAESGVSSQNAENADTEPEADTDAEEATDEKKHKEKLSDTLDKLTDLIEKIKLIWSFSEKRLRRIFTHIYIEKLMVDFVVAGTDACKTAVSYGAVSAAVYNGIALISTLFSTKVKSVDIVCDFDRKEPVYDAAVNVTARPS